MYVFTVYNRVESSHSILYLDLSIYLYKNRQFAIHTFIYIHKIVLEYTRFKTNTTEVNLFKENRIVKKLKFKTKTKRKEKRKNCLTLLTFYTKVT